MRKYTEKELLDSFMKKYNELNRVPTKSEIDKDPNMPHSTAYTDRFGGITNTALMLKLSPSRHSNLNLDVFKKYAIDFYNKNKKAPSPTDFNNDSSLPNSCYIRDSEGLTWNSFLKMCNIPIFTKGVTFVKNRKAELYIKGLLENQGYHVTDLSSDNINAPHSFLVNNSLTVDVRYSSYIADTRSSNYYWKFKLHLSSKKYKPDYFICVGFNSFENVDKIFLFPINEITVKESISINVNKIEKSKYAKYLISDNKIPL